MINSRSSTSYSTSHKLHPLSLLAQLISRQVSGCLKLSAQSAEWRLLFDKGQLNFATNSVDVFERLDRQLQPFSDIIPISVREEMRMLFEHSDEIDEVVSRDYRAISWLVNKDYLTQDQCSQLIGAIAVEVIEPFLNIREGSYELVPQSQTEGIPVYCRLDLRPIVEICQRNSKQRAAGQPVSGRLPNVTSSGVGRQMNGQINGLPPLNTSGSTSGSSGRRASSAVGQANMNGMRGMDALKHTTYTVACIDDSPTVLNAIQKFLEDQSLSVVAINDPVKALMQIVRSKPDLILLDITMPNLDGYELCALLRRHPRYKRTPIVMVTGNTGFIDRARAKLVRASGYLTKPFTQSDLLKIVFKHLPTKER